MNRKAQRAEATRASILAAAGRGFRRQGYAALGVDGLAKEAGVTSGAFYGHFASKADAFEAALASGLDDLLTGVQQLQTEAGPAWLEALTALYTGDRRTCELGHTCALPSLSGEVERSSPAARTTYTRKLRAIATAIAQGLAAKDATQDPTSEAATRDLPGEAGTQSLRGEPATDPQASESDPDQHLTRALALLALFTGATTLARAVDDPALSEHIAHALRHAVTTITAPADDGTPRSG